MDIKQASDSHTSPNITVYSSPTCGYCHMVMEYLDQKGLTYKVRDITEDQEALKFIVENVGQAVTPIVTIDDEVIVGFDRGKIDEALAGKTA